MIAGCRRQLPGTACRVLAMAALLLLAGAGVSGAGASSPLSPSNVAADEKESDGNPAGNASASADADDAAAASWWQRGASWMVLQQRELHRRLTDALETLRDDPSLVDASTLLAISFLYGAFHAAGPGHGKAVISTYLLTHRTDLPRGLLLSSLAALLQALVAIALVFGLVRVAGWLSRDALHQMAVVERVSFALVAVLGGLLVLRAAAPWGRRMVGFALRRGAPAPAVEGGEAGITGQGCGCGHNHHVDPTSLRRSTSRWPWLATLVTVGARPCSGAVIMLVAANLFGLWALGIGAVLMMAAGTAATVSVLALVAVVFRDRVARLGAGADAGHWNGVGRLVALAGGVVILVFGLTLLRTSLSAGEALLYTL